MEEKLSKYKVVVEDNSTEFEEDEENWSSCDRQYLKIYHRGKFIEEYFDGGEPEDNSFYRSYNWIKRELLRAYKLGFEDGYTYVPEKKNED